MKLHSLCFLIVGLLVFPAQTASFDCDKAQAAVEKFICQSYELQRMDGKLNHFYAEAQKRVADVEALRMAQRAWLASRERCREHSAPIDVEHCLKKHYDRRIDELRVLAAGHKLWEPPPAMKRDEIEKKYVHERRRELKTFFEGRPMDIALGKDDSLCEDFMEDFSEQNESIELIAPKLVAHDYHGPALENEIFGECPDLELRTYKIGRSGPYVGPRNFLLYKVDIDNTPKNGKETLFLEEAIWMREPKYGPEIVSKDKFKLLDMSKCKGKGFSAIGASRRYPVDYDVNEEDPQTGLHGVVWYQGKYFLYDVIEWDHNAPPLTLTAYDADASGKFKMHCLYNHRSN